MIVTHKTFAKPGAAGEGKLPSSPSAKNESKSLIAIAFPERATAVFVSALGIGMLLLMLPTFFSDRLRLDASQSNLILCTGLALVLVAFGGQATLRVGGLIMAGSVAIAAGLFYFLNNETKQHYAAGTIDNVDAKKYDIALKSTNNIVGAIRNNHANLSRSRYIFIVSRKEVEGNFIEIQLTNKQTEGEVVAHVGINHLIGAYGSSRRLDWELRQRTIDGDVVFEVWDRNAKQVISGTQTAQRNGLIGSDTSRIAFSFVGMAWAQMEPSPTREQIPELLGQLKTDDTVVRRASRDVLSTVRAEHIPLLISTLKNDYNNYRTKLGVSVALTEMLRKDKARAKDVSNNLTIEDLGLLLTMAGDLDRTIRAYATEFLFDLGDTRLAKLAIAKAQETLDTKARYNQLFAIQDSWRKLKDEDRKELVPALQKLRESSGEQTRELIDKLK